MLSAVRYLNLEPYLKEALRNAWRMAIMKKKATRESNEGEPVGKKRAKLPDAVSDEPKLTKKAVKDAKPGATKKPWKPFKKAEKKKPGEDVSRDS